MQSNLHYDNNKRNNLIRYTKMMFERYEMR